MNREEYLARMQRCPQFRHFGIAPVWRPGERDIRGFCHDEVIRQFHNTLVPDDGGVRIDWMEAAWNFAANRAFYDLPDAMDILRLGATVEPEQNSPNHFRTEDVFIGNGMGAPPATISHLIVVLVQKVADVLKQQGRVGPHAEEYRALWKFDVLPREELVERFTELAAGIVTADDWYLAYEAVHPFRDGNGRSGKILHNWLLGTLADPVLVADHFGGGNP